MIRTGGRVVLTGDVGLKPEADDPGPS
jgi:hypothetical protein